MRPRRNPTEIVESILLYLSRRQYIAEKRHERWRSHDYEAAWILVFEAYYGDDPPKKRAIVMPDIGAAPPPRVITEGQRQMRRRPLRRIAQSFVETVKPTRQQIGGSWVRHKLDCGHITPAELFVSGQPRASRRRCHECASDTHPTGKVQVARAAGAAAGFSGSPSPHPLIFRRAA